MVLKFYNFSAVTHSRRWRGVVMVRRVVTLPLPCYIVRKITTMSVPQNYVGHLTSSQSLVALRCFVWTQFPFCCSMCMACGLVVMCGSCDLKQRKYQVVVVKCIVRAGVRIQQTKQEQRKCALFRLVAARFYACLQQFGVGSVVRFICQGLGVTSMHACVWLAGVSCGCVPVKHCKTVMD